MARGRFGRHRRGSQNLTLLIMQLVREERAAKDRAIFDAYKNGGQFEGKKVDDARLISYIQMRRDQMGKGDPLWDEWNNTLIQTKFAIGEQKVQLAFKQGKVSAGAVAAFYRGQLGSIAKDSAFYREVAGRAAEWAKATAGSARAAARARLGRAIEAAESRLTSQFDAFTGLEDLVANAARRAGLISGNQDVTDANATALAELLDGGGVLGSDGSPVTYAEWQQASVAAYKGLGQVVALRKQAGASYKELSNSRERLFEHIVDINALDDRQKYEAAREQWLTATAAADGDPYAIAEANQKYATALTKIRDAAAKVTGTAENEPDFIGGLENELKALSGQKPNGPTVADLYGGNGTDDADSTFEDAVVAKEEMTLLESGKAYLGQSEFGGQFRIIPYPLGAGNDPFGRLGLDASVQASVEEINGVRRIVYLKGQPVQTITYLDANGNPVDPANVTQDAILSGQFAADAKATKTVGFVFDSPAGGTTYGIIRPDGTVVFTKDDPFDNLSIIDGVPVVAVGGTIDKGEVVPNAIAATKPLNTLITTPINASSNVSDSELARLADAGTIQISPEDRAALQTRIDITQRELASAAEVRRQDRLDERGGSVTMSVSDQIYHSLETLRSGRTAPTGSQSPPESPLTYTKDSWFAIRQANEANDYTPPPTTKTASTTTTWGNEQKTIEDFGFTTTKTPTTGVTGTGTTAGAATVTALEGYLRRRNKKPADVLKYS